MAAVIVGVPVQPHTIGVVIDYTNGKNLGGGVDVVKLVHNVNKLFCFHAVSFLVVLTCSDTTAVVSLQLNVVVAVGRGEYPFSIVATLIIPQ